MRKELTRRRGEEERDFLPRTTRTYTFGMHTNNKRRIIQSAFMLIAQNYLINKQHRAETQEASAVSMAATDYNL